MGITLISCSKDATVRIISTGEKTELDAGVYKAGDTVVLWRGSSYYSDWEIDKDWRYKKDTVTMSVGTIFTYRLAVVE